MNVCVFDGRFVDDPDLKTLPDGKTTVVNFRLAVDGYKDKVNFLDFECWGARGSVIANNFKKGDQIFVQSEVEQQVWGSDDDRRSKLVFKVNGFSFGQKKRRDNDGE